MSCSVRFGEIPKSKDFKFCTGMMFRRQTLRRVLNSYCKRRYNGPVPKKGELGKSAVPGPQKGGESMFNPRNGMIAVTLIGAGLAINVMMSKKKEKKKVIDEVTLPIVQKKKLEPKPPQETTFDRYLKTKETSGEKQMCDYCDKMNMSPSEYSSEVLAAKSKDTCHSCGKMLPSKNGAVIASQETEVVSIVSKEEEVAVELLKEKTEDEDDRKALARQVALQATLAASMGILAGVSYHIIFDRRLD